MFYNRKRIVILMMIVVLPFAGQVMAQTTVMGFQLDKSTYNEVKTNLPKSVMVITESASKNGSSSIVTDGTGYNIDGLRKVILGFNKEQKLEEVLMILEGQRFNDVKKILFSKYRSVRLKNPEAPLLFKANSDYVYLSLPCDKDIEVHYMTGAFYRHEQLAACQTIEDHKALVRKEKLDKKKALERESEKF